jgi:hypothetical protein
MSMASKASLPACIAIPRMRESSATVKGSPCSQRVPASMYWVADASSSASAEFVRTHASPNQRWWEISVMRFRNVSRPSSGTG